MIRRDFDLEEMKYFLNLVELSTDDYLYIFDFTNDRAICSKSITDVFPFESNAFENATAQLKTVVHPDDIDMLMEDLQEGINGRRKEHNLEYRWKTVDGTYVAINCRGQYVISHGIKYLIGRISEIGKQSRFDNNTGLYREVVLENVYNEYCKVRHSRGFLMLVGVDNFKELNEKYGAKTGDEVLNILTDAIRRYIDTRLRIFRMPGDECAIFMPYTIEDNIEQAKNLYKRIRNRIDRVIEHRKYDIFFTISAGAAEFDTERDSFNDLLKNAKSKEELRQQIESKDWENFLTKVPVKAGDFFYVPSGTMHAIGPGILILETQQSSDTTYRVYDFDRRDDQGNQRELHIQQSLEVLNLGEPQNSVPSTVKTMQLEMTCLTSNAFFTVYKWKFSGLVDFKQSAPYLLCSVLSGNGTLTVDSRIYCLKKGDHFLLPNNVTDWEIDGQLEMIVSHPNEA